MNLSNSFKKYQHVSCHFIDEKTDPKMLKWFETNTPQSLSLCQHQSHPMKWGNPLWVLRMVISPLSTFIHWEWICFRVQKEQGYWIAKGWKKTPEEGSGVKQRKLPATYFYKDQVIGHCSHWPTGHSERNSGQRTGWSILYFRKIGKTGP